MSGSTRRDTGAKEMWRWTPYRQGMLLFEVLGDEDEGGFPEAQMVSTIVAVVKAKSMVVRAKMSVLKTRALVLLSLDDNNVRVGVIADDAFIALYATVLPRESEVAGGYEAMTDEWGPPLETI
jgi:hypothetical protein